MTSIIKVDQIQTLAGAAPTAADLGLNVTGALLQMQYSTVILTSVTSTSATKSSIAAVTITPKFATSKIKVSLHCDFQQLTGNDAHMWLARNDGSGIYNAITDGAWNATGTNDQAMWQYFYGGSGGQQVKNCDVVWICDAKVNTPITFTAYAAGTNGASFNIGANQGYRQIIVEEIAG